VLDVAKRVLMMSHGITGVTGFANQLWLQGRALLEAGYEVYVVHRDYRGEPLFFPRDCGAKMNSGRPIDGFTFLPIANQQWGEDILPYYIDKYKVDYVHTLGDIWCYQYISKIPKTHNWKWLAHYVFDTENMVGFWNECVRNADISVVPSLISYNMLKHLKHKNIKYVPHGVDTKVFKPATEEEKIELRKEMNIKPETFVIGMVAHNQYRKFINRLLDAFSLFHTKNPDSLLILHCSPKDITGWDIPIILKDRGMLNCVLFTDKASKGVGDVQVPETEMRNFYCIMDVHALSTGGEGFGVPLVEAMACGIPNVATAYTTPNEFFCEEIIEPDGSKKLVPERGFPIPYTEVEIHHTGGIWAKIGIPEMATAFQQIKDNPGEAKQMGMKARKFAIQNYDIKVVKKEWQELYNNFDTFAEETDISKDVFNKLRLMKVG
jgi:glycosyltransferase involved in cell wall biosynthesis